MVNIGDKAPTFQLPSNENASVTIPDGKPTVLFFYPKDDTPGCTTEAKGFTASKSEFAALGVEVLGLSPDPVKKHHKFATKHDLSVELVSDEELTALQAYGVWVEKSMYGRTYMGVDRSTFLIAADGTILQIWRKVRVKGHVDAVLQEAKSHFG